MFLVAKRPLEYVAFFCIKLSTKEGPGYLFVSYDSFQDFIICANVEKEDSADSLLKNIYFLTVNPEFVRYAQNGFTIVLNNGYKEISERINNIIKGVKGRLIFDTDFNEHLSVGVRKSLIEYMKRNKR